MPEESTGNQSGSNWIPVLGDTETTAIVDAIVAVEAQMPFLIGLSKDERLRLAKVGDRTRPFLQDALATALANPGLLPRSVDVVELRTRVSTLNHLGEIKRTLQRSLEKVSDSETLLASELYGVTRTVYTVMKTPAAVPGLNEQHSRLKQRFARKATRRSDETTPAEAV